MKKRQIGPSNLLFPMPAVLVGTYGEGDRPNAMTAAWTAICCYEPPCVGVAIRAKRLTFENLEGRSAFTLNIPRSTDAEAVDYVGIVSGRKETGKLETAGLETRAASKVDAPILVGCPVNLECRLVDRLALGSHTWFVGQIVEVQVDEGVVTPEGKIDLERLDPLIFCTSEQAYYRLGPRVAKAFSVGRALKR